MERRIAQVISVIFYPLFVPTYAFAILLTMPAYFSALLPPESKWMLIGLIFLITCLLPTVFIFIMYKAGIITTKYLSKREDRTMPYIITTVFFYLAFYMLKKLQISPVYYFFVIGATMMIVLVMGINLFWKISSHTAALGALAGMTLGLSFFLGTFYFGLITLTIILAGITGYARLKLEAHTPAQVYAGFLLGFFTMVSLFLYQT